MNEYAFCENVHASGYTPWHIRRLGEKGLCLGGGADTLALCGREVHWDKSVKVTAPFLRNCCQKCAVEYRAKGGGE